MAEKIKLRIITPNKEFYNGEVSDLHIESVNGKMEILPGHVPLISILKPTISKLVEEEKKIFFSSSGIIKVSKDKIIMLCDACEWPYEIDIERAEKAKKRAEERINDKKDIDVDRAKLALIRALTRIKIKGI